MLDSSQSASNKLQVLLLLAALAIGCTGDVAAVPFDPTAAPSPTVAAATTAAGVEPHGLTQTPERPTCLAPVRVGVLLDKSYSVHENVIPQMTPENLEDLIGLVNTCAGGEIAVGVLCNVSGDKPFARLYLSARPAASGASGQAPKPARDPFTQLLLAQAAADAATQQRHAEEREAQARARQVDRFRKEVLDLAQAPVSCTRTDVIAGANRLLTYLAEPLSPPTVAPPARVAVFITDGVDTARRQTLRRDSELNAVFMLVGGSPNAGALAPLNPVRFESVTSAFRWLRFASTPR